MYQNSTLLDIYDNVFCGLSKKYITVFLCGGSYNKKKSSLRDRVKPLLENNYSIRVLYPEELMMDVLKKKKDIDLLSCERILADNSDFIVIISESAGSLVELGAFVNNPQTTEKTIAGIASKHKKDKSFIVQGPIKYLENKGKGRVFYYSDNASEDAKEIFKCIKIRIPDLCGDNNIKLNTIIGLHYLIQFLLFFYGCLSINAINDAIFAIYKSKGLKVKNFDIVFRASISYLYKDRLISKVVDNSSNYELTSRGINSTIKLINECKMQKTCDRIRLSVLYDKYYKAPQS